MATTAKFTCTRVTDYGTWEEVQLRPVYAGPLASEEDKAFWTATPSGEINLTINNEAALGSFVPRVDYYVTFEEATE
jgi:hypothetical protein